MSYIVTTTQLQKHIGTLSDDIKNHSYIVTNRGEGRIVMLPYFQGCDDSVLEYMEDYEMKKNKEKLVKRYKESCDSGDSDLVI
ncbi:hypothetical protein COB57_03575 [Candidatus Peregrinibacteria bacterium]|nr:MAG: hypothetical protein COB57_03575 [Candidatus Peregrinibacteria bacterium]